MNRVEISTIPTEPIPSWLAVTRYLPTERYLSFEFHFFPPPPDKPFRFHSHDNREKRIIYLFISIDVLFDRSI